jgi:hypothetical protein
MVECFSLSLPSSELNTDARCQVPATTFESVPASQLETVVLIGLPYH